jgi:hypothetical protein
MLRCSLLFFDRERDAKEFLSAGRNRRSDRERDAARKYGVASRPRRGLRGLPYSGSPRAELQSLSTWLVTHRKRYRCLYVYC